MNSLPKVICDLIMDYKSQLSHVEKFAPILKEINHNISYYISKTENKSIRVHKLKRVVEYISINCEHNLYYELWIESHSFGLSSLRVSCLSEFGFRGNTVVRSLSF